MPIPFRVAAAARVLRRAAWRYRHAGGVQHLRPKGSTLGSVHRSLGHVLSRIPSISLANFRTSFVEKKRGTGWPGRPRSGDMLFSGQLQVQAVFFPSFLVLPFFFRSFSRSRIPVDAVRKTAGLRSPAASFVGSFRLRWIQRACAPAVRGAAGDATLLPRPSSTASRAQVFLHR